MTFRTVALALFAVVGCTQATPPLGIDGTVENPTDGGVVPATLEVKAKGLYVTDNPMEAPPGTLIRADNAVINRQDILEVRRGNKPDAALTSAADALTDFTSDGTTTVIGHTGGNKLFRRTSTTTSSDYTGTYVPSGDYRMRFAQENNNLYALTSGGVYRLSSPSGTWGAAGAPPALEGTATVTGASGFLDGQVVGASAAGHASVAYRFAWGNRDTNGNLHLGSPSGRVVVTNSDPHGVDVVLSARLPAGIVAGTDFLQVYRTAIMPYAGGTVYVDPGEEMALVAELFPTAANVTAGTISYTDVATTENGPVAYFAPSQGGLVHSREVPPIAKDIATFRGYDFYAVTAARQRAELALLAVGGTAGLVVGHGIRITYGDGTVDLYQGGTTETTNPNVLPAVFKIYTTGTAAQNIENTARSLVRVINLVSYGRLYATYASAENDTPGKIVLLARSLAESPFSIQGYGGSRNPWSPALQIFWPVNLNRGGNVTTAYSTTVTHGLTVGQTFTLSNYTVGFTGGTKTVATVFDALTITYSDPGADTTGTGVITTNVSLLTSTDGITPNTYARSDYNEAESVPLYNYAQVGSSSATLYRIIAQGDSLWFFTSEGLFRLTGTDETDFTLRPFDMTVHLVAPDSVVATGNKVWAWTDDGIVSISEAGVDHISQPIDKVLRELRATFESNTPDMSAELAIRTFALGYESEHEYRIWLPTTTADAYATQCYVYNFLTGTWTRHVVSARAGIVSHEDDRLYLADTSAQLRRERKARTAADYQDADGVGIAFDVVYAANVAQNPGGTKLWKKGSFLFETTAPASVGVQFATEVNPTYSTGSLTTNGLPYVSTYLPVALSRSAVLYAGVTHSTAAEKCAITGVQVEYEAVSNVLR